MYDCCKLEPLQSSSGISLGSMPFTDQTRNCTSLCPESFMLKEYKGVLTVQRLSKNPPDGTMTGVAMAPR